MSAPTVRRRRLGATLRQLREDKSLKLEEVAAKTGFTGAKLSRVETGRVAAKPADVEKLLDVYGVRDRSRREGLVGLAREGGKRGWWQTYKDILSPVYSDLISLEAEASGVRTFQPLLIPGLLQTAAYARAVIAAINMTATPDKVNALVDVRIARQSVLNRPDPLALWAIIHEAALKPVVMGGSGAGIMRDQLQRLLDLAELPHVNVQVMPADAAPHPGAAGGFTILGFPERSDLDVVLLENLSNSLYIEDATDVELYGEAFERLRAAALPFDRSLELIEQTKEQAK
ncbi:helix-turn-helix transcriptional regulator [Streptomyces sp. BPTC-684]|uniref:helix-turn-helix domain-containing protein n=1 Tax=Streptomyces sp. BPTC-684 TaxID=3043734 RepID=UPI0024B1C4DF|nr:helix-turn-helix transcriptional regulator [Streptomyces sp. BPTC-684]WHM36530.1 helix-turn-helix transcriptional regulator [Streptomyces sp. BPTC-684]